MTARAAPSERRIWAGAGGIALVAHVLALALVLGRAPGPRPVPPEPVVLIELPAEAAPAAAAAAAVAASAAASAAPTASLPTVQPPLPAVPRPVPAAPSPAALPPLPVAAPVSPARATAVAAPAPAAPALFTPVGAGTGASPLPGTDPRARKAEVDYFSLVSVWLNRRKSYPAEARKARQEGVVIIRFTVDRVGNVSAAAIKRGSGHDLLDRATLDLLQRVAPLPRMPDAMQRQTVTLALPIEYSLKTS